MTLIGIIGAGGHAKGITEIFLSEKTLDTSKLVFFSNNPERNDAFFGRFKNYNDTVEQLLHLGSSIDRWHAAIGNIAVRKEKLRLLEQLHFKIITAVHPSAVLSPSCSIGRGSSVMAGCVINSDAAIGKGCIVNTSTSIDHDCQIGSYVNIGPGSHLAGGVVIGDETELGTGTIVIPNVKIGKNCIIGAGSVVIRSVPDNSRAVGVPAKLI